MALFASSYIPTVAATITRNADSLSFPFTARPEAITIYLRFLEQGTVVATGSLMVLAIGTGAGNNRLSIYGTAGVYTLELVGAGGTVTSSPLGAAPSIGNAAELLGTVTATGQVQLSQSINGAAPTSGIQAAANAMPQAWNSATLYLNNRAGANTGFIALTHGPYIVRGIQSFATMRRYAGVA